MSIKIFRVNLKDRLILFLLISILIHFGALMIIPKTREGKQALPKLLPIDVIELPQPTDIKKPLTSSGNTQQKTEERKKTEKPQPLLPSVSPSTKEKRIEAEKDFKEGRTKAMISTSSLELGIDIGSINLVIQYLSPRQVAKLLQRVGRSGHTMKETSFGIMIAAESDDCFESAAIAKFALEGKIEPTKIYGKSLDVLGQQMAGMSLDEYNIPLDKAYKIVKGAYPFRDLSEKEFQKVALFSQKVFQ